MLGSELSASDGALDCAALGVVLDIIEGAPLWTVLGEPEPSVLGAELSAPDGAMECAALGAVLDSMEGAPLLTVLGEPESVPQEYSVKVVTQAASPPQAQLFPPPTLQKKLLELFTSLTVSKRPVQEL